MSKVIFIIIISGILFQNCGTKPEIASSKSESLDKFSIPFIEAFFSKISAGNYINAIDDLLKSNDEINLNDSLTINLKTQFKRINEFSGKYTGSTLLKKRNIGNDIGVYSYLVKYEKKYYRFVFFFYFNGKDTRLSKLFFDDSIDTELEESLKLYTY